MPEPVVDSQVRGVRVHVDRVSRTFGDGPVLEALQLEIAPGSFVALLGPSGCGKSTLLRLVSGLDRPDAGAVHRARAGASPRLGFVFQDAHLLPWRTVLDNTALPLELAQVPVAERRARARALLAEVGLEDAVARLPHELSGGMRMRVSLARALVTEPDLLLLDEPFAALDELTRHRLDDLLRAAWLRHGPTVLFVTHSVDEAAWLAERALVFSPRPARVVADLALPLPAQRTAALRSEPAFTAACRALRDALERGGA